MLRARCDEKSEDWNWKIKEVGRKLSFTIAFLRAMRPGVVKFEHSSMHSLTNFIASLLSAYLPEMFLRAFRLCLDRQTRDVIGKYFWYINTQALNSWNEIDGEVIWEFEETTNLGFRWANVAKFLLKSWLMFGWDNFLQYQVQIGILLWLEIILNVKILHVCNFFSSQQKSLPKYKSNKTKQRNILSPRYL